MERSTPIVVVRQPFTAGDGCGGRSRPCAASNHWTIFWINLLGRWTVILWIVALVMSFGSHETISHY